MKAAYDKKNITMRSTITILVLMTFASTSAFSQTKLKADTVRTVGVFISPYDGRISVDFIFRIYKDSIKLVQTSPDTYKRQTIKDTVYWLPTAFPIIDTITKRQALDSLGNPKNIFQWVPTGPSYIIHDFNKRY